MIFNIQYCSCRVGILFLPQGKKNTNKEMQNKTGLGRFHLNDDKRNKGMNVYN